MEGKTDFQPGLDAEQRIISEQDASLSEGRRIVGILYYIVGSIACGIIARRITAASNYTYSEENDKGDIEYIQIKRSDDGDESITFGTKPGEKKK